MKTDGISKLVAGMTVVIVILVSVLSLSLSGALGKSTAVTTITQTAASGPGVTTLGGGVSTSTGTFVSSLSQSSATLFSGTSTNVETNSSSQSATSSLNFTSLSAWCSLQSQEYGNVVANATGNPLEYTNVSLFERGEPGPQNVSLFSVEWQIPDATSPPLYCLNVLVNGTDLGFAQATRSNATGGGGSYVDAPVGNITVIANRDYNVTLTALFSNSYYVTEFHVRAQIGYSE